jgi:hypothetical protein
MVTTLVGLAAVIIMILVMILIMRVVLLIPAIISGLCGEKDPKVNPGSYPIGL